MARLPILVPLLALAACADVVQPTVPGGPAREALGAAEPAVRAGWIRAVADQLALEEPWPGRQAFGRAAII